MTHCPLCRLFVDAIVPMGNRRRNSGSVPDVCHAKQIMNVINSHLKVDDVLNDNAPYPYTLSAFIAFLSDNHCLEILEFIFEARRYRHDHQNHSLDDSHRDALHQQWLRLLQTHIVTGAAREINITDTVRGELLDSVPGLKAQDQEQRDDTLCPDPGLLEPALKQMHDLLYDSIIQRFIMSCLGPEHTRPMSKENPDNGNGTGTNTPERPTDGSESEHQRQTTAEIHPFPLPAPSNEEPPREPLSRSRARLQFHPRPRSRAQSQTRYSSPQARTTNFDTSRPSSSIVFYDDRPDIPFSRKRGSVSSGATATRSMPTASDGMKESTDLVRTRTMPTKRPDVDGRHRQHHGLKRRWHRLPLRGGIFRHFKKESSQS